MPRPKKLVELNVQETSGVDHPAHLHEGFAVMKSNNPENAMALFSALGKDRGMGTQNTQRPGAAAVNAETAEAITKAVDSAVTKAVDTAFQPILDKLAEAWKDLRAEAEKADEGTPSTEGAPAADPAAVAANAELLKSLPGPVQEMLRKSQESAAAAEARAGEALAKAAEERDIRLDGEAIAKAKTDWPNLTLTDDMVKSLRRADEPMRKSLTEMLTAQNAQLDGGLALTKELGTVRPGSTSTGTAQAQVLAKAQSLVDSGQQPSLAVAKAFVYETDAALAAAVREETQR